MAAALPPGVWWAAHSLPGRAEPYGPHAGGAAVDAARRGDLQLQDVDFSYPLRPEAPGEILIFCVDDISGICGLSCALCIGQAESQSQKIVSPGISAAVQCHVVQCHAAHDLLSLEGCCGVISCLDSAIPSKGELVDLVIPSWTGQCMLSISTRIGRSIASPLTAARNLERMDGFVSRHTVFAWNVFLPSST